MKEKKQQRPLTPKEVAGMLGLDPRTIRKACRRKEFGYQINGRWYIERWEIEHLRMGGS